VVNRCHEFAGLPARHPADATVRARARWIRPGADCPTPPVSACAPNLIHTETLSDFVAFTSALQDPEMVTDTSLVVNSVAFTSPEPEMVMRSGPV